MLASESKSAIELFDAQGEKQVVLRDDIEELNGSTTSIMPEGFEKQIAKDEMTNLLEFLTQRGKYTPLNLEKFATITSARGMFINKDAMGERMMFDDWGPKTFEGTPFQLTDPQDGKVANVIMLYGPRTKIVKALPKSVELPCNAVVKKIHMLSGVSGWGHPFNSDKTISVYVRLKYIDGETEVHELRNAIHFADYIRHVDVPGSKFAFDLQGHQLRYLAVEPKRAEVIETIELAKGPDGTAPIIMAITIESPEEKAKH